MRKYQTIIPWIFVITAFLASDSNFASAHIMGANVISKTIDNYEIRFQALPLSPNTERPTTLGFSVLDQQGYNVWNIEASVKVQKDGNTIFASPETKHEISDIFIEYVFREKGNYKVILEAKMPNEPEVMIADFELTVVQNSDSNGFVMIMLTGGIVGGITGALFLMRRAKSSKGLRTD